MTAVPSPLQIGAAVRWVTLSQAARQAVQLLTIVVLARSLAPADFGLMTMALVVIGFLTLFKDLGVGSAVIHRAEAPDPWLSSLFWLAAAVGLAVTLLTLLVAPAVAAIYREPALTPLLRVMSASFVIVGFGVVQQAILERDLRYRLVARAETTATVMGSIAAVLVAINGGGVWSLVVQVLGTALVDTLLMWWLCPWRPSLGFRQEDAWSGGSYGAGLTTFNAVNYVARNADYFLVGRSLGPEQLGYYTLAYRLMLFPLQMVTSVVNRVMFPSLSRVRQDPERFASLYFAGVGAIAFAAFPIALGLGAVAPRLIPIVLGPGWQAAVPVAMVLSLVGLLQSVGASVGPVFLATGAIRALVGWGLVSTALVVGGFLVGLQWGILGVAVAYLFVSVVLIYPSFVVALRPLGIAVSQVVEVSWRALLIALSMAGIMVAVGSLLSGRFLDAAILAIQIGVGIGAYAGLSLMFNRTQAASLLARLRHG